MGLVQRTVYASLYKSKSSHNAKSERNKAEIYSPYPKAFVSERGWWYTRWARRCLAVGETCVCRGRMVDGEQRVCVE
jgi:hypothetical protein